MLKSQIKYFDYASVDFLIDRDGVPVFMEVNDNTLAPYYIEQKSNIADMALANNKNLINLNNSHLDIFIDSFRKHLSKINKSEFNEDVAIICKRKDHPKAIDQEIEFLLDLFHEHGYRTNMYIKEECTIQNNILYTNLNKPAVIYRRNFDFPPNNIKQTVVNNLKVRNIANDKYKTHQIVEELIRKKRLKFRQPETYLVEDECSLFKIIKGFHLRKVDCIAKPNSSYGGNGFYSFMYKYGLGCKDSEDKLYSIIERLNCGEKYIIQECIRPLGFRSNNKEYCFDIRVMVYGGRFAGIEGRRSNVPYSLESSMDSSLVTNISSGGIDLIIMGSTNSDPYGEIASGLDDSYVKELSFNLDSNFLVLNEEVCNRLKIVSESIILSIDKKIQEEVYEHE